MSRLLLTLGIITLFIALTKAKPQQQQEASAVTETNEKHFYHPAVPPKPQMIEQYEEHHPDGHYEYRYVLSNGDTRYERADWVPVGNKRVLARRGYYSYPLPNHKFMTVFYTADHQGYRQDYSSYTQLQPLLPRHLEVKTPHVPFKPITTVRPFNLLNSPITERPN